jgi:glycosyltransferase involved in cell wall biosynthesis
MKVAIVGDYPLDSTRIRGGVQAAFAYLVKGLSRIDGLRIHVLTFRRPGWTGPDQVEQNGVILHLLPPIPRFERIRNYRTYQSILNKKLAQIQPQVVHAQNTDAHAYVAIRSSYPTVVTAHGIRREDGKHYGALGQRVRGYFDSMLVERFVVRHVRYLIAISRYVTSYYSSQFRSDLQVYYVPNAVDARFFQLVDTSDGGTILFAGRVTPLKRVMDLVQAFAKIAQQVPAAQLCIAGECDSERSYVESVRGFIQRANLGDRVHLLGALAEDAILDEFARCDVLALSSVQENLPLVIAQAMAAGKPVVATRVGGVAEMVSDGETGFLVDVGDIDELASALLHLLQDPALRARMGQAGRGLAVKHYYVDTVAQRTHDVYRQVAALETPPHA